MTLRRPHAVRLPKFHALALVAALAASVAFAGPGAAAQQPTSAALHSELPPPPRAEKHPKLDSNLLAVASTTSARGLAEGLRVAGERKLAVAADSVRVVVRVNVEGSAGRDAVVAAGGQVDAEYADLIQAFVPVNALWALADLPIVSHVRRPATLVLAAVTDEGVAATNANIWHGAGRSGAGVKVGVIDGGFAGYTARQASGDLPPTLVTADFGCGGGVATRTEHGTAVAEIVYKMAPGAQLYLICIDTIVNLGQAKDYAVAQGIKIVNLSGSFPHEESRGDGTGTAGSTAAIVADAKASGILWVNAAGNHAEQHWTGNFVDADGDNFNEFVPGSELNTFVLGGGQGVCASLRWDQWPTTGDDWDLFLYRTSDQTVVQASTNAQTGTETPWEGLCFLNSGATQTFGLAIWKLGANGTPRFDLFIDADVLTYRHAAGSVAEPATSGSAFAVGAICWQNDGLESFSSQGPTIDGRVKPDIAGPDATSSSVYGPASGCTGGFPGTSASAPHVAGAAALVAQANPAFTPSDLQSFLEGRAINLGPEGKDNQYGSGKLWLGSPAPVVTAISPKNGPPAGGTSVTVRGSGFSTTPGATTIKFGATPARSVNCITFTVCTAVSPAGTGVVHITVTVSGQTSAATPADEFVYATAFQDGSPQVSFNGAWTSWSNPSHSGGSARYSNQVGASVGLSFTGASLTLVYLKQANTGIATVLIDGTVVDQLDTYSPTQLFQQTKTYPTTAGSHTVSVAVSGNKNASSSGIYVVFDAFMADGAPARATFQDGSAQVSLNGAWTSWANPSHSGGTARYSNQLGARAGLSFTGTSLTLVYVKQSNTGIATVTIDGTVVDQLDTYSPTQLFQQQKSYPTGAGSHTVSVAVSGNKNASSTGTFVVFDAFMAEGAVPSTTFQDGSPQVTFTGAWTSWPNSSHSGGSARYSNQLGARAALSFTGTSLTLVYVRQANLGIATVTIDGTVVDQLDTYSPTALYQQTKTYPTAAGSHTVSVAVSGNKNASSTGTYVVFDAFTVTP